MDQNKIIEILKNIKENVDFESAINLVDNDIIDSFDIVMLVGELNEAFDVEITMEHLVPENFNSVEAMLKLVKSLQE